MSREPRVDRDGAPLPEVWMREVRAHYHPPGDPPREEMWQAIEARIAASPARGHRARRRRPGWVPLALAAGVALLGGLALGRGALHDAAGPPLSAPVVDRSADRDAEADPLLNQAVVHHLGDTEALLSFVAADARSGRVDGGVGGWGRELLTRTRLLLDSPAADDPQLRPLLEDLEIVLAGVALLDAGVDEEWARSELELIADGVAETGVRWRIRTLLPRGPRYAGDD